MNNQVIIYNTNSDEVKVLLLTQNGTIWLHRAKPSIFIIFSGHQKSLSF